jgi:hypothetical protein
MSTNLSLPFLQPGQAQKHVTVNESLIRLDALEQLSVMSATTSTEPVSPDDGQLWVLPSGKTGAHWGSFANAALAYYRDGAWEEIAPREGWLAFVKDTDQLPHFSGSAWTLFAPAKLVTVSATAKVPGRSSSGAGSAEEISGTAAGRALDDVDAAAHRATLGLGTAALAADSSLVHIAGAETVTGPKTFGAGAGTATLAISGGASGAADRPQLLGKAGGATAWAPGAYSTIVGGYDGDVAFYNGVTSGRVYVFDGAKRVLFSSGMSLVPGADNVFDIGAASYRRDRRDQHLRRPRENWLPPGRRGARHPAHLPRRELLPVDAVCRAQGRAGGTAQSVAEAFKPEGLDPARYGLFCVDELIETAEETRGEGDTARKLSVERPVKGEDGQPAMRLGLRYDQLFALALGVLFADEASRR